MSILVDLAYLSSVVRGGGYREWTSTRAYPRWLSVATMMLRLSGSGASESDLCVTVQQRKAALAKRKGGAKTREKNQDTSSIDTRPWEKKRGLCAYTLAHKLTELVWILVAPYAGSSRRLVIVTFYSFAFCAEHAGCGREE